MKKGPPSRRHCGERGVPLLHRCAGEEGGGGAPPASSCGRGGRGWPPAAVALVVVGGVGPRCPPAAVALLVVGRGCLIGEGGGAPLASSS